MSLFVVQHRHEANRCPAGDPKMAQMLLKHLSPQSTKSYGLTIRADAVVNNAHTFVMIVEGPDRESVNRFMQPFAQAGTVDILPASTCEAVVTRGGCAAGG
ncbi:MAG TPA: DUF3303 family protein [bacterium]|nr:DUF3303 family protein [bacterium]